MAATYRYHGHHVGDIDRAYYRKKEEEELWVTERDPIDLLASRIGDDAAVGQTGLGEVDRRAFGERCSEVDDRFAGFAGPGHPGIHSGFCLLWGGFCHLFARRCWRAVEHEKLAQGDSPSERIYFTEW